MAETVLALAFGILVLTAIGHAIWLSLEAVCKAIFCKKCPVCGRKHFSTPCPYRIVAKAEPTQPATFQHDMVAAQRVAKYAAHRGWLNDADQSELENTLRRLSDFSRQLESPAGDVTRVATQPAGEVAPAPRTAVPQAATSQPAARAHPAAAQSQPADKSLTVPDSTRPPVVSVEPAVPLSPTRPQHALDRQYESPVAQAPFRQRLTADLLRTFMEQSNIRWIELISASLIVICSVGLVISLWNTLSSTSRFFPSLVFLLATVAVHGAGQYTLRQWKLRSTSRGILHIGLMLIPLAVLVGILLSTREGRLPTLDITTVGVMAIGIVVYGALAFTASRSLFARRWPLVAVVVMLASLTLLPIHFLGTRGLLNVGSSTWILLPLLGATCVSALIISRSSVRLASKNRNLHRVIRIFTQCLFASLVMFAFWLIQTRDAGQSDWWWVASGCFAAMWGSWGWATSLSGLGPIRSSQFESKRTSMLGSSKLASSRAADRQPANRYQSAMLVVAWSVAVSMTLFLVATVWNVSLNRTALVSLAILISAFWMLHGWWCGLRISLWAGAVALLGSITLIIETPFAPHLALQPADWLSFLRITTMTCVGISALVLSQFWKGGPAAAPGKRETGIPAPSKFWVSDLSAFRLEKYPTLGLEMFSEAIRLAGSLLIVVSAALTIVASISPLGATPYGGNWAALYLMAYGVLGILGGIVASRGESRTAVGPYLLAIGQLIMLLATVRLCQTSPLLEGLLHTYRPMRAWAIGTALLALGWSGLGAFLRNSNPRSGQRAAQFEQAGAQDSPLLQRNVAQLSILNLLCVGALITALISVVPIWFGRDDLHLASCVGWFLPLTCWFVFLSWRGSSWREASLVGLGLYACSLLFAAGNQADWWNQLGLAASCGAFTLVAVAVVAGFERLIELSSRRIAGQPNEGSWIVDGDHWASRLIIFAGWAVVLFSLLGPAAFQLAASLGADWQGASVKPLLVDPLSNLGCLLVLLAGVALTGVAVWPGRQKADVALRACGGLLPLLTALAAAAWVTPVYALPAALWVLAIWTIAGDLAQLASRKWKDLSTTAWQVVFRPSSKFASENLWLPIARTLSVVCLLLGSAAFLIALWWGDLPNALGNHENSWVLNFGKLLICLGPAMSVFGVRWAVGLAGGELSEILTASGIIASILAGVVAAGALVNVTVADGMIVFVQTTSLVAAILAWNTAGLTMLRNLLGLQKLSGQKLSFELSKKAMKGARWRNGEQASWSIICFATVGIVALCLAASTVVIAYPAQLLPGLTRLGGLAAALSAVVTAGLFWMLAVRREITSLTLLPAALGLGAPLAAATYAGWLTADATRSYSAAMGFEPFRLLIGLWLFALCTGLFARWQANRMGRSLTTVDESAWVMLAGVVTLMSFVSITQDPNQAWPLCQLSVLALLAVLSSAISEQIWRGHVAAILAAAGVWGWSFNAFPLSAPYKLWFVLAGPVWVGLAAIGLQFWRQRRSVPVEDNETTAREFSVDLSASLSVPVTSAFLSFVCVVLWLKPMPASVGWMWCFVGLSCGCFLVSLARLWDKRPGFRGLAVYVNVISAALVLATCLCFIGDVPRLQAWLLWLVSGLGALAAMAGLLREGLRESSHLSQALRLPLLGDREKLLSCLRWMPPLHTLAACLALIPAVFLVLVFEERTMRIAATTLPFLGALAILPIAVYPMRAGRGKAVYRYFGLSLISFSLVLLWWADLPSAWVLSNSAEIWIFVQRAFAALVTLGIIYPILARLLKSRNEWEAPFMHLGWVTLALGGLAGCGMLIGEFEGVWKLVASDAGLTTKLLSLAAWAAVVGRLLQFAIRPVGPDIQAGVPLRKAAVFAAEAGLGLFCATAYFHFPNLFAGVFVNWWPLVVFAIAMLSAGIGEWCHRIRQPIIADPVLSSSLLLPMIPLAGVWWIRPESADWLWNDWASYALLLASASGLYGLHGWLRNSIGLRSVSACLALFAFWSLLHSRPDLRFFSHPQFWLLPPSIATLLFVELNRTRLDKHVVLTTRYVAILIAYFSSTSEILLKAFEGQLWQPLLLLMLALAGVAAGILLRVRAFLYCGSAFTFVALLGMVWHAQQAIGQIWPWWAFGIATGVSLIALLGYFEKNRPRVIAYLEQLKQWEH